MDKNLQKLDYKDIFYYFSEISGIPRGSGNEGEISNYLVSFAKSHNLEYTQDEAKNVIIIKEATIGYEDEPAVLLQGHMDMVCEKLKEGTHDFLKDGIKLIVTGDFLHADGTTLGADNGIAIAYILALLSDNELPHPRLEAVITTDEEVGMYGAKALDTSILQAKYMINLDSEEEGYLLTSCAGGLTGTSSIPINRLKVNGRKIRINLGGLKGGHSGMDIGRSRTNANKLLGRLLFDLREVCDYYLDNMLGGFKDNVIPREAYAELVISDISQDISTVISDIMTIYKQELSASEPELSYTLEYLGDGEYDVLHPVSFEKFLFLLNNNPYGVQVMSSNLEGLVESSLNLGLLWLEEDKAVLCNSVRSSKGSYKYYLSNRLRYLVEFLGGEYYVRSEYPAWEYKPVSPLREHLRRIYRELYKDEMKIEAIHAGLECGLLSEKMPELDIVSIGPDIFRVHTIDERVSISSTIRVYKYLEMVLKEKIMTE